MTYLVAPLNKELHNIADPEVDVFAYTRLFPEYEALVGLGFQQNGFGQPAALIIHGDDIPDSVVEAVKKLGLEPGLLSDEEYEERAFTEAGLTDGDV